MGREPVESGPVECKPTTMAAGGDAIARASDGRVVFVNGALPGERVRAEVTETKRDYLRARTIDVLAASSHRVPPFCPHVADGCGGCDWQHVDQREQRVQKRAIVIDALRRIAKIDDADELVASSSDGSTADRGHRTTVRAAVRGGRAGYRRASTHDVVVIGSCAVAHPLVERVLVEGRFPGTRQVTVRVEPSTGALSVVLDADAQGLAKAFVPGDLGATISRSSTDVTGSSAGPAAVHHVGGASLRVSDGAFFQSSQRGVDALVAIVDREAGDGRVLIDLYGGVGLFAVTVGRRFANVVSVERSAVSSRDARENLATLSNATAVHSDVHRWRPSAALLRAGQVVVIADPARDGLGAAGADTVAACEPTRVVLVSCDAASLGRDAALLGARGLRLVGVELVDMFPYTSHVEAVSTYVP